MPDWFESILRQSPTVALAGLVAYYAFRKLEAKSAKDQKYERDLHAKALKAQDEKSTEIVKAKDAEIRRLKAEILKKIKELGDAVEELKKKGK